MKRTLVLLLLAMSAFPADAKPVRFTSTDSTDFEAIIANLIRNPPHMSVSRLPRGTKIGRCLLVVDGQTRISGPCSYSLEKSGNFHFDGPRQVFDGIDYPQAEGMAAMISTDWWANVFKDDGGWTGYSNEIIGSVHGQESRWGTLMREGACYSNVTDRDAMQRVRVCLWKK